VAISYIYAHIFYLITDTENWLLITELAPGNDKIVYRIRYNVYRILCYIYGLLKMKVIFINIILSLRRERRGEGDKYYLYLNFRVS